MSLDYIRGQFEKLCLALCGDTVRIKLSSSAGDTHWIKISEDQAEKIKNVLTETS